MKYGNTSVSNLYTEFETLINYWDTNLLSYYNNELLISYNIHNDDITASVFMYNLNNCHKRMIEGY